MRSKGKVMFAALLAAFMLSAIASASASAAPCTKKAGSKKYALCVNGQALAGTETSTVAGHLTSNFTVEVLPEGGATITCTKSANEGQFWNGASGLQLRFNKPRLEWSGCTLSGNVSKKCAIEPTQRFSSFIEAHFESAEAMKLSIWSGEDMIWNLEWKNRGTENCTLKSIHYEFYGKYECKLSSATTEAVEHALPCASTAKDAVTLFGNEVPLSYTEAVALSGTQKGLKFSVYEA
jgi:hypothetical protein